MICEWCRLPMAVRKGKLFCSSDCRGKWHRYYRVQRGVELMTRQLTEELKAGRKERGDAS